MFWFLCCKIGLFPVLLHRKKVVYQFAASHFDSYLISLKTTFPFIFLVIFKLRCFQYYVCKNNLFLFFVLKTTLLTLYLTENMFWVFSNCSGSCEPYLTQNSNLVFRCKIRCFKLHRNESMFWFVGIKI